MPRDFYSFRNDDRRNRDNSFGSCLCILLIFIAMCSIIILITTLTQEKNVHKSHEKLEDDFEVLKDTEINEKLGQFGKLKASTIGYNNITELNNTDIPTTDPSIPFSKDKLNETTVALTTETTSTPHSISNEQSTILELTISDDPTIVPSTEQSAYTSTDEIDSDPSSYLSDSSTDSTLKDPIATTPEIPTILESTNYDEVSPTKDETTTFSTSLPMETETDVSTHYSFSTNSTITEGIPTIPETAIPDYQTTEISDITSTIITITPPTATESSHMSSSTESKIQEEITTKLEVETSTLIPSTNEQTTILETTIPVSPIPSEIKPVLRVITTTTTTTSTETPITETKQTNVKNTLPVCEKPSCKSASASTLNRINYSEDQCENFYDFACGGGEYYQEDTTSTVARDTWQRLTTQINALHESSPSQHLNFRKWYENCTQWNQDYNYNQRVEEVKRILQELKMDQFANKSSEFNLHDVFSNLILTKSLLIFDVDLEINSNSKFMIKVTLPHRSIPDKDDVISSWSSYKKINQNCLQRHNLYGHTERVINLNLMYDDYSKCQGNIDSIRQYFLPMVDSINELGLYADKTIKLKEIATKDLKIELLDLLNDLNDNMYYPTVEERNAEKGSYIKLAHLPIQKKPLMEWNTLFYKLTDNDFNDDTLVEVHFVSYIGKMLTKLSKLPHWKVYNIFLAIFAIDLYQNIVLPKTGQIPTDINSHCLQLASNLFPHTASTLYLSGVSDDLLDKAKDTIDDMFPKLKARLTEGLQNAEWLIANDKSECMSQLDDLEIDVIKTEKDEDDYLEEKYLNQVLLDESFARSLWTAVVGKRSAKFRLVGETFELKHIMGNFVNTYDLEPKTFYQLKLIVVPVGLILNHNTLDLPSLSMAKLGSHIAVELGRHFDSVGKHSGIYFSPDSLTTYDEYINSANNQFQDISMSIQNQLVTFQAQNKLATLSTMGTSAGFRLLTDEFNDMVPDVLVLPWLTNYNKEQFFYLAIVQEYCKKESVTDFMLQLFEKMSHPISLQIQHMLINSERFAEVFNCKPGQKMNYYENDRVQFPYFNKIENDYYDNQAN